MTYDEIKNILSAVDDPVVRLEMVMDLGKQLSPVPDGAVCSEITGCASHVEICRVGNRFYGMADSDLVRGIVAIMMAIVDGKTPDEIKKIDIFNSSIYGPAKIGNYFGNTQEEKVKDFCDRYWNLMHGWKKNSYSNNIEDYD